VQTRPQTRRNIAEALCPSIPLHRVALNCSQLQLIARSLKTRGVLRVPRPHSPSTLNPQPSTKRRCHRRQPAVNAPNGTKKSFLLSCCYRFAFIRAQSCSIVLNRVQPKRNVRGPIPTNCDDFRRLAPKYDDLRPIGRGGTLPHSDVVIVREFADFLLGVRFDLDGAVVDAEFVLQMLCDFGVEIAFDGGIL
jgi:hypothetical protein